MKPSLETLIKKRDDQGIEKVLKELNPYEIADILSIKKEEEQLYLFDHLDSAKRIHTFDYLVPKVQRRLVEKLPLPKAAKLLADLYPDDRNELLKSLPKPLVSNLIKLFPPEEQKITLRLLGYKEGTIGSLMTTDYIAIKLDQTVEQALDTIISYGRDSETIDVLYVIDDEGRLLDDIYLRELLLVPRQTKIANIANRVFVSLSVNDDDETAVNIFRSHDRTVLPVVDDKGYLLGIVTIDDILRLSNREATEDIQKIGGSEALDEPYMEISFLGLMKKRAGWLVVLFLGEMLTATALGYFEEEISKAVVLALFLPLIISSGGNAGSQASTLIIRAMALQEVKLKDWFRVIRKEIFAGLFLGCVLGIVGFFRVSIWSAFSNIYGEHWFLIALTIWTSLIGVVTWGTFAGAFLPFVIRKAGLDPATSSAPFVATIVDVVGLIIYFMIAIFMLKGTLL